MRALLTSLALLLAVPAWAQGGPAALYADPAPDATHPAGRSDLAIPSHGQTLIGSILLPSGAGPHPLLLLAHGFPGHELNLDLGQAARRQGWAVATFHYRGSWGSPGAFSFGHTVEDGQAVLDWLLAPAQVARFRLDPARVVVGGHSMGGFVAAQTTAARPQVKGLILMDAWNPGIAGREASAEVLTQRYAYAMPPLAGTSPQALAAENTANAKAFDLATHAAALATRPVLIMSSLKVFAADNNALAATMRQAGAASVTVHDWPTDHSFSDHRIKLTATTLEWLKAFEGAR
ncbi:alpha/beta hydrolase family protein [Polymorphobacter sp.]|uniref:alpha/beta hydrolase family protein n=1 Tax=Polymorphobacter sp. TaxID=1909290 RepID=UPI003F71C41D